MRCPLHAITSFVWRRFGVYGAVCRICCNPWEKEYISKEYIVAAELASYDGHDGNVRDGPSTNVDKFYVSAGYGWTVYLGGIVNQTKETSISAVSDRLQKLWYLIKIRNFLYKGQKMI